MNAKTILWLLLAFLIVLGYVWYQNGGHNPAKTVQGKIFSEQMKVNGRWENDHCYFVFGEKKQGYGSLYLLGYTEDKVNSWNDAGRLSNELLDASQNYNEFWDTNQDGNILTWPNGLAIPTAKDGAIFPQYSISVNKISGIFTKKIEGEASTSNVVGGSGTHETRLVEYAKIK